MPIAYDIGMHNGDDTAYYLAKGYDVVAVEANPALCKAARLRFAEPIAHGRLKIVNVAISDAPGEIEFYLHNRESEWGTIVRPAALDDWTVARVPAVPLIDVINRDQPIGFIKIDIEGADLFALESLDRAGLRPLHLSCEAHNIRILCKLILMNYARFRLVNGKTARKIYKKHRITTLEGERMRYAFSRNSSGPFGSDLPGEWYGADQIMHLWGARTLMYGSGWFDVHAQLDEDPAAS
jgi:FkbM family methyltransferase